MATVLYWLFTVINYGLYFYMLAMVVYVLMSWFPGAWQSRFGQLLGRIVGPWLNLFRIIPPILGIDFSPLIAFFVLDLIRSGLGTIFGALLMRVA
ncbi:YggT family protein [Lacticaseibacillus jixianensis]|uniref:YggT family protein n=1 Tax=Lacticaseibacillus jixianensis TaxID=2486012 RepID=A0ABW4B7P1_9LACO|nr:YggT family protein [Lacticaseibacillus jixianensis]